jgi:hypothetical protein
MRECGANGMDMSSAAAGFVIDNRRCNTERNPAQIVMKMTGPRMDLKIAELGSDNVLCSQSLTMLTKHCKKSQNKSCCFVVFKDQSRNVVVISISGSRKIFFAAISALAINDDDQTKALPGRISIRSWKTPQFFCLSHFDFANIILHGLLFRFTTAFTQSFPFPKPPLSSFSIGYAATPTTTIVQNH